MISIAQIAGMARMFLPSGSPWIQKIEQAQKMAESFQQSPDGVRDLMRQLGKGQEDIRSAVSILDNRLVANTLNRISPDLAEQLRAAGNQLADKPVNTQPETKAPSIMERFRRL